MSDISFKAYCDCGGGDDFIFPFDATMITPLQ